MVFQRLTKAAVVLALASSIGFHWAIFQSLAWVGMVVTYSQETTITEALAKTFDGQHPCALCKQIAKGKRSENKSDMPVQGKKLEFSFVAANFVFCQPWQFWKIGVAEFEADVLPHAPAVPPPKPYLA